MKTSDPYAEAYAKAARAAERCQYHTPTGRQCACLIQDPQSKFCPRHSESSSTDTQNFADLLAESAEDFQTAEGINHSLAHLFRLLAGGHISTRRATGLAYIASLLLRTLPGIKDQLVGDEPTQFEIDVPARGSFIISGQEKPTMPPEPADDDSQGFTHRGHSPQQPPAQACLPRQALATQIPISQASPQQASIPASALEFSEFSWGGKFTCLGNPASRGGFTCRGSAMVPAISRPKRSLACLQ